MTKAKVSSCKRADSPEPSLLALNSIKSPFEAAYVLAQMANFVPCEQRMLWRVCTFAESRLSLRHCSKNLTDFCTKRNGMSPHLLSLV